jgi:hypothetical protein
MATASNVSREDMRPLPLRTRKECRAFVVALCSPEAAERVVGQASVIDGDRRVSVISAPRRL